MTKGRIFLVGREEEEAIFLEESGYITEDELQRYLERFPELIPGEQIDPEDPKYKHTNHAVFGPMMESTC